MSFRSTIAGLATAVALGAGTLIAGSIAGAGPAEAAPGWHGHHRHHGHFGHSFRHPGRYWGGPHWGYRPAYAGFYGGACYTVLKTRFVPGYGFVERPVTRCR